MSPAATPIKSAAKGISADAKPFDWEDPFFLDEQLSEEEIAIRDAARDYCQDKLMTRVLEANRHEKFHREIMNEMGALGLLGSTLPEKYGCAGANYSDLWPGGARSGARRFGLPLGDERAVLAGHASDLRLRHRRAAHEVPAQARHRRVGRRFGSPSRRWLRSGRHEDPRRHGARRLQGLRLEMWITNSPIADVLVIWAKLDGGAIRGFILERGMKGLATPKIEGKFSLRASVTGAIMIDKVMVPADNMLPNVSGLGGPFGCLNNARYGYRLGRHGRRRVLLEAGAQLYARPQAVRPAAGRS